jgi:uncharacterized membrane protein
MKRSFGVWVHCRTLEMAASLSHPMQMRHCCYDKEYTMPNEPQSSSLPEQKAKSRKAACAVSGKEYSKSDLVSLETLRPSLAARIRQDHPDLPLDALLSKTELARYRTTYVEELLRAEHGDLTELDEQVAKSLATHETLAENIEAEFEVERTLGERLSDHIAKFGGSWTFIISFFIVLMIWIAYNQTVADPNRFDPYPYILLNLILSCVAALQAPVIMMSQKRQEVKDRMRSQSDYKIDLKAELEIRHLHEKMDHLISRQWQRLTEIQQMQLETMHEMARSSKGT